MTNKTSKPGFFKLFAGGFVLGAVALVGFQTANAEASPMVPAVQAASR